MTLLSTDATLDQVKGIVHADTQEAACGLDLTVAAVYELTDSGAIDFGGSEAEAAARREVEPHLAHPDDDYAWWTLSAGTYVVRFNETLALGHDGAVARLYPLPRLMQAGAHHPCCLVDADQDPLEVLMEVSDAGCRIKENSRLSRLVVQTA
jgi:hypothetical protein